MSIPISNLTATGADLAFALASELAHAFGLCPLRRPQNGLSSFPADPVAVRLLVSNYHSTDLDGSRVMMGDERGLGRWRDLQTAGAPMPSAGDYFIAGDGSVRDVIAARLDPTETLITLQLRRSRAVDFGDPETVVYAEDFGRLPGTAYSMDYAA
jgi:hypothetical protein